MAAPPLQRPVTSPNAGLNLSAAGRDLITEREGVRDHYYDDVARNCTYGVGQLAHMGPCSFRELRTRVPDVQIRNSMATSINRYENVVRLGVPHRALNQNQFDALTSFVFNVPALAPRLLRHVEAGEDAEVVNLIGHAVNVHGHNAHGHVNGPAVRSPGLVLRRRSEVDQYNRR